MGIEEDIEKFNEFYGYALANRDKIDFSFSFEEAVLMPDDEFSELYLRLMNWYIRFDCNNVIPPCALCGEDIPGPEQLKTYDTNPYHPACFKEVYDETLHSGVYRQYFNRILNLEF